jgi:hypothetical protein
LHSQYRNVTAGRIGVDADIVGTVLLNFAGDEIGHRRHDGRGLAAVLTERERGQFLQNDPSVGYRLAIDEQATGS